MGHATQRLAKAQEKKAAVELAAAAGEATPAQVAAARSANWKALVEYASTAGGAQTLREQLATFADPNDPSAVLLRGAVNDGALLAQANRRAENEFRASQGKGPLTTPLPLTVDQQEALEVAARQKAEAEAARAADPLGLRAAAVRPGLPLRPPVAILPAPADVAAGAPAVTVPAPAAVAAPVAVPVAAPVAVPMAEAETATLPVTPPAPAAPAPVAPAQAGAPAGAPAAAPLTREQRAAEAQRIREERRAEAERIKEERRAEAQRVRTAQMESRKLRSEVSAEVKATRKWVSEVGTKRFSAPENTWSGPLHWSGAGPRPSFKENREAARAGRARYGEAFSRAMNRYAGEYSASDVLAACEQLEAQGRDKVSGRVRPNGWYAGYTSVDDQSIAASRQEQFEKAFGPQETDIVARQYVAVNVEGVLWRARANRPDTRRVRTQLVLAKLRRAAVRRFSR